MLVTGGSGFLGRHLALASEAQGWELVVPPSTMLDIRQRDRVIDGITGWKPTAVVHLAYQRDDRRTIVDGSRYVAEAAAICGARMIHMSTDVVFPGRAAPYTEGDATFPITEYGRLKRDAEQEVLAECPRAAVVRTSLLYGTDRLAPLQRDVARAIDDPRSMVFFTDEYRCPAHAADVAAVLSILAGRADISGPLHVAGPESINRADLAKSFARWLGHDGARLVTGTSLTSGQIRPLNVALDTSLAESYGFRCRSVAEALSSRSSSRHG
jgi:dTDP-4-dehydrorhamnose reductase